jgi:hypothetical protein
MDHTGTVWALLNDEIPLWLKVSVTLFVCLLIPVYWVQYGPGNFLWFSDLALLLTVPALWLESALLASMILLAVGLLEVVWIIDFAVRLITGVYLAGLSRYMFNPRISPVIRVLSLFHLALPPLLLWMVYRLGYDSRALGLQTLMAWIVLPLSYWLTEPSENVNWVHGFRNKRQTFMPAPLYVALLMALFPLVIYFPTHLLLNGLFP